MAKTIPRRDAHPHVRIENLTKTFDGFTAVDRISRYIYQGEFFSLLGPSGCGKTTLLRMLAGFEAPSAGCILLQDEDMASVPPYRRPVNMMFQSYALFPHLTVERNVAFGLKQDKVPKSEIAKRAAEALERVQLGALSKRKSHQLSGGQRQRVALARCLVKRPKLLLLDEPLAALDRKLREQTRFELMNIQHEVGITFVIVTHDQEEAMTVSSRIAVMNRGRIVQVGTPAEVYEDPNSRYVAEFVGDVNIIEGRIAESGPDHALIESAGCTLPLSWPGVVAGCFLVFLPAVGEFVIPDLLGGSETLMIGKTLWSEFFNNRDWPLSSAAAVLLLLILVVPIVLFQRLQERRAP